MRWYITNALIGAVAWIVLPWVLPPAESWQQLLRSLFLLAPLVIVPLGLSLVEGGAEPGRLATFVRSAQPFGAAGVVASFFLGTGIPSGLFASAWMAVTGLAALHGVARAWRRRVWPMHEACIDAALLFLPVGAGWLALSRLGVRPMGFDEPIVFLTALHFHYAGFAAALLTGLAGRALPSRGWLYPLIALAVVGGVPLLAAGFVVSPVLKVVAAPVLATGLCGLALLTVIRVLRTVPSLPARLLLLVSSASVLGAMALAVAYAFGEFTGRPRLSIPDMARWHGVANALGFSLCGVLAWSLAPLPSREKMRLDEDTNV